LARSLRSHLEGGCIGRREKGHRNCLRESIHHEGRTWWEGSGGGGRCILMSCDMIVVEGGSIVMERLAAEGECSC
jgi:hypothetical protein